MSETSEQFSYILERLSYRIREAGEASSVLSTRIQELQQELASMTERFAATAVQSKATQSDCSCPSDTSPSPKLSISTETSLESLPEWWFLAIQREADWAEQAHLREADSI